MKPYTLIPSASYIWNVVSKAERYETVVFVETPDIIYKLLFDDQKTAIDTMEKIQQQRLQQKSVYAQWSITISKDHSVVVVFSVLSESIISITV